ncbi:MAG TPA: RNA polymerase sigma-70 factor [Phototrophicaceae bacterium]|nr:RNA polymerase sigma-70 factor [Phototrophicaceae bacterium]
MTMMDTITFESYRPLMFSIAYRMLGSAMEAEDIVQEAYLRAQSAQQIEMPKAFLTTIVTRLCLDHLKSAHAQRETYIGPWLPEPLLTAQTPYDNEYESISMAFLVLLESLTPVERAVFLLREVFDYDYSDIAKIVGKEEAACRQSFHRAKAHIAEHRPRFEASREEHEQMLYRFMQACVVGDLDGLTDLLAEEVLLTSDGGGKASTATHPIFGSDKVARFWIGLMRRLTVNFEVEVLEINGRPSVLVRAPQEFGDSLISFEMDAGKIRAFYVMRNPDKLRHLPPAPSA